MQNLYGSSSVTSLNFWQTLTLLFNAGLVPNKLEASAGISALKNTRKLLWGTTFHLVFIFYQANLCKLEQITEYRSIWISMVYWRRVCTDFLQQGMLMNVWVFQKPICFWLSWFLWLRTFGFIRKHGARTERKQWVGKFRFHYGVRQETMGGWPGFCGDKAI